MIWGILLDNRRTSYILLLINLILVLFITVRSGSVTIEPKSRATFPLTIEMLEQHPPELPDTLILNDFEKLNDMMNMYDQGGEYSLSLSGQRFTHGKSSLLIDKNAESNTELATVHFPRQWKTYTALELDIYNDSDAAGSVWLRIGSQYDARKFYVKSQKYAEDFVLEPGANTITIPVKDIIKAFGRLPHRKSIHLNFPGGETQRYYLDFLRMVRDDDSKQ